MNRAFRRSSLTSLAFAAAAITSACCGISAEQEWVEFGRQTNIIVWDEANKMEHFVRNATFRSKAKDFGFIAPTPSVPELAEADEAAFYTLSALEPQPNFPTDGMAKGMDDATAAGAAPEIIQEKDVAGYRATTLKASDAAGLAKWMKDNGYATSPEIEEWTKHYIAKGWYLTTFKVLGGEAPETGCVRMSFKTDQPFNPYYVPKNNAPDAESRAGLQLYFVAAKRYSPDKGLGTPKWSTEIPQTTLNRLAAQLRLPALPGAMKVTSYFDAKFPNPDVKADVFFSPAPMNPMEGSASTILFVVLGGGLAGYGIWRLRRRPTESRIM